MTVQKADCKRTANVSVSKCSCRAGEGLARVRLLSASSCSNKLYALRRSPNPGVRLGLRTSKARLACVATLAWAISGPVFHFSDTWQLVINTGTTVATFLMIFILQHSQNRDSTAIQAKLDELIRSSQASNKLIRAERLTEKEVEELRCDVLTPVDLQSPIAR